MAQGVLGYQYEAIRESSSITGLAGLGLYLDLLAASGLFESIRRHIAVRAGGQGWDDVQQIVPLVMLQVAGGDCVEDLNVLNADDGLMRLWRQVETYGMTGKERRAFKRRHRRTRTRSVPSATATRSYLAEFHDPEEEAKREPKSAYIPEPTAALKGIYQVLTDLIAFAQRIAPQRRATLDMDATTVPSGKAEALFCYKGFTGYQPLNVYWFEHGLTVASEFRDGNVPAGYRQLSVFKRALDSLPAGVEEVLLRSDTAGYEWDLLKYCAEGKNSRFGIIEFAVGADVTQSFKNAVALVAEKEWHPIVRTEDGACFETGQEWAEVCYVPEAVATSKTGPEYRFLAIREALKQQDLPGLEDPQRELPFPTMEFAGRGRYKLFAVVTNRHNVDGEELIWWHRERAGDSEQVHAVMKDDLAGGTLPSGLFGANAAWWSIMILALNLTRILQRYALTAGWANKRLKALRYAVIRIAGWVTSHARRLTLKISDRHPGFAILLAARARMLSWSTGPAG